MVSTKTTMNLHVGISPSSFVLLPFRCGPLVEQTCQSPSLHLGFKKKLKSLQGKILRTGDTFNSNLDGNHD